MAIRVHSEHYTTITWSMPMWMCTSLGRCYCSLQLFLFMIVPIGVLDALLWPNWNSIHTKSSEWSLVCLQFARQCREVTICVRTHIITTQLILLCVSLHRISSYTWCVYCVRCTTGFNEIRKRKSCKNIQKYIKKQMRRMSGNVMRRPRPFSHFVFPCILRIA